MQSLPPTQTAQINGRALEYITSGSGSPTIVLINGAGGPLAGWHRVYADLEALSTVFAYNRPGIGGSDRPDIPQTGDVIVTALHELLAAAGMPPPYVLVGHSLGGLYANLFARRYVDTVAGIVFLEAAAPGDTVLNDQHQTFVQKTLNGIFGIFSRRDPNAEVEWVQETVKQIEAAGPFPDVPLTVISGGKRPPRLFMSEAAYRIRADNQRSLAGLSAQGEQVIAAKSGHFPQFAEPEVIVSAIRDMIARIRS